MPAEPAQIVAGTAGGRLLRRTIPVVAAPEAESIDERMVLVEDEPLVAATPLMEDNGNSW